MWKSKKLIFSLLTDARILYLSLLTNRMSSNLSKLHCLISLSGEIVLWTDKVNSSVILSLAEACHICVRKDLGVQITVSEKGEPVGCHICHPALRLGSLHTRDLSLHWVCCHKEPCRQQLKFSELLNICLHRSRCPRKRSTQKDLGKWPPIALKNSSLENVFLENSTKSKPQFCLFFLQTCNNNIKMHFCNTVLRHIMLVIIFLLWGIYIYYWLENNQWKTRNCFWDELKY